jgi:hypothetical protein
MSSLVTSKLEVRLALLLGLAGFASSGCDDGSNSDAQPAPGERHLSAIGVQLYTVRAAMEADFEGTLRSLAGMGYREVEFAGLFGHDPAQVRSLLAELGLSAVGSHVDWTRFRDDADDAIEETLAPRRSVSGVPVDARERASQPHAVARLGDAAERGGRGEQRPWPARRLS